MKWALYFACSAMMSYAETFGQFTLPLYPDSIPNSRPCPDTEFEDTTDTGIRIVHRITRPTLTVYLPKPTAAKGLAMIICPGGGYKINALNHEGHAVGRHLAAAGITAFVLKYRIPDENTMIRKEIGPLQDLQRAIQLIREGAGPWGLITDKIGVMGFSAGGHLAASLGTHWRDEYISNPQHTSLRPDFLVLVYPVISFSDSIGHSGSRENLIGKNPDPDKIRYFSNELQVNELTPPAFLVHAKDDWVKVQNSLVFARALNNFKIPNHLLIYEDGGHGFGMIHPKSATRWMEELEKWLKKMGVLPE